MSLVIQQFVMPLLYQVRMYVIPQEICVAYVFNPELFLKLIQVKTILNVLMIVDLINLNRILIKHVKLVILKNALFLTIKTVVIPLLITASSVRGYTSSKVRKSFLSVLILVH